MTNIKKLSADELKAVTVEVVEVLSTRLIDYGINLSERDKDYFRNMIHRPLEACHQDDTK
jgi:hypothetical protein